MSRDGNGNYFLPAGQPVTTGTTIDSTVFNLAMSDIRDALTQSLSKDGQTTPTANLPMGGNRHTGVSDATVATQYASAKQVQNGSLNTASSVSNVVDAYAASISPAIALYTDGMRIVLTPTVTNTTTAPTLSLNGLGAKAITKENNIACVAGDLVLNVAADLVYTSQGSGSFLLLNPQKITGARITATIPDASHSANVPLKNAANIFVATQTIQNAGNALVLNGTAGFNTMLLRASTTASNSFGASIWAGTNASDICLDVGNAANTLNFLRILGDGTISSAGTVFTPSSGTFSITASGDATVTVVLSYFRIGPLIWIYSNADLLGAYSGSGGVVAFNLSSLPSSLRPTTSQTYVVTPKYQPASFSINSLGSAIINSTGVINLQFVSVTGSAGTQVGFAKGIYMHYILQ